ncbi:hypothetical protein BS78_02G138200 [Paspalum vaginatum]|nr:hypothetical protein BS78_02G138200 [Paspalum vaginatum]
MFDIEAQNDLEILPDEELDNVFRSTYNETTGGKSSRLHGRGYLAKRPKLTERMRAEMDEQARATAATKQKNVELEEEVRSLKEKIANEAAERREMEERQDSKLEILREEMRTMVAQNQSSTQQPKPSSKDPTDSGNNQIVGTNKQNVTLLLFQNKRVNGSSTYITSQQLLNLSHPRTRSRAAEDK